MTKKLNLNLELTTQYALDKDGKKLFDPKNPKEPLYKQHDAIALFTLLEMIDTRVLTKQNTKDLLNVKDKAEEAFRKDKKTLELSIDQASALKEFLNKFFSKEKKLEERLRLNIFLSRTVLHILEQLDE